MSAFESYEQVDAAMNHEDSQPRGPHHSSLETWMIQKEMDLKV